MVRIVQAFPKPVRRGVKQGLRKAFFTKKIPEHPRFFSHMVGIIHGMQVGQKVDSEIHNLPEKCAD
jgi:hypothetical protein